MGDKVEMMTTVELVAEVQGWLADRDKELEALGEGDPGVEILAEAISLGAGLLALFQMSQFAPCQSLCVLALQTLMLGPEHIEKLNDAVNGLHSGQYVLVGTKNLAALVGAPAGRA